MLKPKTRSETCTEPPRKRAGWYHIRVRRFRSAAVVTCPIGHAARCADMEPDHHRAFLRIDELWRTLRWATLELCAMRDPWPRCYVTPSYSGGKASAYVDGKLRRPQCFGSHREAWAQPVGTRWTVHGRADYDLALTLADGDDWVLTAPMVVA
jgi:hypothetical protein